MGRQTILAATAASLLAFALSAAILGCGPGGPMKPSEVTHLVIWNRSEFELLELYVTTDTRYIGATSLLPQPLADEGRITIQFGGGEYVTVVRRRVAGGERIAFTTAEPVSPSADYSVLIVFQESFRLQDPDPLNGD